MYHVDGKEVGDDYDLAHDEAVRAARRKCAMVLLSDGRGNVECWVSPRAKTQAEEKAEQEENW